MKYVSETESAFVVRLPPEWRSISFPFAQFANRSFAYHTAKLYAKTNSVKCSDYRGNTSSTRKLASGTIGVNHEVRKDKSGNNVEYWTASYQDNSEVPPKQRKKRFSVSKYGTEAERFALEFRYEKMGKLKPIER